MRRWLFRLVRPIRHPVHLVPLSDLERVEGPRRGWRITGERAELRLEGAIPGGWIEIQLTGSAEEEVHLQLRPGSDARESFSIAFLRPASESHRARLHFWPAPRELLLLVSGSGRFEIADLALTTPSRARLLLSAAGAYARQEGGWTRRRLGRDLRSLGARWSRGGCDAVRDALAGLLLSSASPGSRAPRRAAAADPTAEHVRRIHAHIVRMKHLPTFTVVLPVDDADEQWLRRTIESVRAQYYPHWDLRLAQSAPVPQRVTEALRAYGRIDPRIRISLERDHATAVCETRLTVAAGPFVAPLGDRPELAPDALYEKAALLNRHPEGDAILTGETSVFRAGERARPPLATGGLLDARPARPYSSRPGVFPAEGARGARDAGGVRAYDPRRGRHGDRGTGADLEPPARMAFDLRVDPTVSIITVASSEVDRTRSCLRSLHRLRKDVGFEVIVVGSGPGGPTGRLLREEVAGVRSVLYDDVLDPASACNRGAERARGKYLLFLDGETRSRPDLLVGLVAAVESVPNAGAVGARLVDADGWLREGGAILWRDGTALAYGRGDHPDEDEYSYRRSVDFASPACLLVRRDLFETLGGFDPAYLSRDYQGADLCLRIWNAGHQVVYDPFSELTILDDGRSGKRRAPRSMKHGRRRLRARWNDRLAHQPVAPRQRIGPALLRARGKDLRAFIAIVDDRLPAYDQGAGYPRMYQFIACLLELGYHVTFLYASETPNDARYIHSLRRSGVEVITRSQPAAWFGRNGAACEMVILSRPPIFATYHELVRRSAPRSKLLYDSEALWHRRVEREAALDPYPLVSFPEAPTRQELLEEAAALRKIERAAVQAADGVIFVSEHEAREMETLNPTVETMVVPTLHDVLRFGPAVRDFPEREDLLLVGGFFNDLRSPNVDSVLYFLERIFPLIREKLPTLAVHIAGSNPPPVIRDAAGDGIFVHADLPTAALQGLYFRCRVAVVPQRFGSGVKYKVTEAMSLGVPLVLTSVAVEGTGLADGESAFVADGPEPFATRVIELYNDKRRWLRFATSAFELARTRFGRDSVKSEIGRQIDDLLSAGSGACSEPAKEGNETCRRHRLEESG